MLPIERDLSQIERFRHPDGGPVLSLYLDLEPTGVVGGSLQAQLDGVLEQVRGELAQDPKATGLLDRAVDAVVRKVGELDPRSRAVAAFVSPDVDFLRVVPLPDPVVPAAYWDRTPHLMELLASVDEHERAIVALVDREHARVYRVFMGQIEEVVLEAAPAADDAHSRERSGRNGSRAYGQRSVERRHEWHVRRHLERVLEAIRDRQSLAPDRVLVGGARETVHELLGLMPSRIRSRTRLISGLAVNASGAEVLARVMETQERAEREAEEELIDNLLERDRSHAVFGAPAVLEAVSDAHVHTLVYGLHEADSPAAGSECDVCGWLMEGESPAECPRCDGPMRAVPALVERMVHRVLAAGGRVEEVRGPASRTLELRGGLAALLRYQPSMNGHSPAKRP